MIIKLFFIYIYFSFQVSKPLLKIEFFLLTFYCPVKAVYGFYVMVFSEPFYYPVYMLLF